MVERYTKIKPKYLTQFLAVAFLVTYTGLVPAHAETSLIEVFKEKETWVGKVEWIEFDGASREERLERLFSGAYPKPDSQYERNTDNKNAG